MTGLRQWDRDPTLPAQAGQEALSPPTPAEVRALVREHLLEVGAPDVALTRWEYARWKPDVSMTCVWRVSFADGTERLVATKRYADDKARELAERHFRDRGESRNCLPLRPRCFLPAERTAIWCDVADRALPGQAFVLDARKLARLVEEAGYLQERLISRSRVRATPLRYKPERRAVWRVALVLRDAGNSQREVAVRVLPPAAAARIASTRRQLPGGLLLPTLIAADVERGVLIESWLDVVETAPDEFRHAAFAGELLARLHANAVPSGIPARSAPAGDGPAPLFAPWPDLAAAARALPAAASPDIAVWTHGDFHPDQVAARRNGLGPALLDLDCLGLGDPARDLASWIADALVASASSDLDLASGELRAGYLAGGGSWPAGDHLGHLVAEQLLGHAAGALRRLEVDAVAKARRCLALARELAGRGVAL